MFDSLHDETSLSDSFGAIVTITLKSSDDSLSVDVTTLRHEPSRRFRKELNTDYETDSEYDLESNRESPVERGVDVRKTEIDPIVKKSVSFEDRNEIENEIQLTSKRERYRWRSWKLRYKSGDHGCANESTQPSKKEWWQCSYRFRYQ